MSALAYQILPIEQGSPEWFALRKTKITATDASVIMGVSPWKTRKQLYEEKLTSENSTHTNEWMQRGIDLEPIARELFTIKTGIKMNPAVVVSLEHPWMMASLDGLSECGRYTLEIKCPGAKDHYDAIEGRVPSKYIPQNQHIIQCVKPEIHFYYSFDGIDGEYLQIAANKDYIEKMMVEEKKFYDCFTNRIPPEPSEDEYIEREDEEWLDLVWDWTSVNNRLKDLQKEEEEIRERLIALSGGSNVKGGGISLCKVQRKGNVDYSKIPELKGMDLEPYRKSSTTSWRITSNDI